MMDKVQAIRLAILELGEASDEQLEFFARERLGIAVDVRFVSIIRTTLKQWQMQADFRQRQAEGQLLATPDEAVTDKSDGPATKTL
jgi:hypothetical protein